MSSEHTKVFTYAPNIIGYARIILLFAAFHFSLSDYKICLTLYTISLLLDIADGHVARALNQTSRFGAALDMLTDKCVEMLPRIIQAERTYLMIRMATPGLLLLLSHFYESWATLLNFVLVLEVGSHYFHFYNSLLRGATSHKIIDKSQPFLLRIFYGYKPFFSFCCIGYEAFLIILYLVHFNAGPVLFPQLPIGAFVILAYATFPSFICKICVHIVQLLAAVNGIARHDWEVAQQEKSKKRTQ